MHVRGAPLIGVTAAYGVALAMPRDPSDAELRARVAALAATRPDGGEPALGARTACASASRPAARGARRGGWAEAQAIADDDVALNDAIGRHGSRCSSASMRAHGRPVNVLTHCNAGWLATVDWGTALAPIYMAHDAGIPVHVWVDETRPRNQGLLTAWELASTACRTRSSPTTPAAT